MNIEFSELNASEAAPDVLIIGSGPAGLAVACGLEGSGLRVLVVEGGNWTENPAQESAYYSGEAVAAHPTPPEFRRQRFGGTSHLWGGRCVPLDALDFEKRPQVPLSGWPISLPELLPYYEQANQWMDAGEANFYPKSLQNQQPLLAGLGEAVDELQERIERYSLPTDVGQAHRARLSASTQVQMLLHTRVVGLNMEPHHGEHGSQESVSSVALFHVPTGERKTLACRHVVVCGGGLEATRLLLATQQRHASWARFSHSLGKYYTCHFDAIVGRLVVGRLQAGAERPPFEFERTRDGVYARRKLQFTREHQHKLGLLNGAYRLHFPAYADASHGSGVLSTIYLVKSILPGEHQRLLNHGQVPGTARRWPHVRNVLMGLPDIARFAWDYLFRIKLARRKLPYTLVPNRNGSYPIEFNGEQIPHADNQVSLLSQTDPSGMPNIRIQWKLTEQDVASAVAGFKELQRVIGQHTSAKLEFDVARLPQQMAAALPVGGHHMGTTRMGVDGDGCSVVNANLGVHGVHNLSVCAASVMPTCGHANPTLTVVALAFRLADHLKATLQK